MTTPGYEGSDLNAAEEAIQAGGPLSELGVTGLRRTSGYLDEEFLPQLKGRRAVQVYREMADNDAIVGALLFSINNLLRNVDWNVSPGGKSTDHAKAAKFLETCMHDMSHTWQDFITEALTCLIYGYSWHEIVYKRRGGPWAKDGRHRSQHTDGLVGWRRLPIRAQETTQRWIFDDSGGIQGMVQLAPPDYQTRILPIERSLLFRFGAYKNSPEGKSMLRNAYRSWFYKKRLEEFESIGVERDLAGLPKIGVPAAWLKAPKGTPQAQQVEALKRMVRGIRRNEQEGILFPIAYDEETKQPMFTFDLVGSGGGRQFQTDAIIQRYEQRILMTVLADFILVGHESTGTYNMHADKTGIFKTSLNAIAHSIADTMNRHAIPRLFAINGWKPDELPKIVPSDVDAPDLTQLAGFLSQTAGLGFTWLDADMEKFLRSAAGLPELPEADFRKHKTMLRWEESTRYAQAQTEYLAAQSQLEQTKMGMPTGEDAAAQQQAEGAGLDNQGKAQANELAAAQGQQQLQAGANDEKRKQELHEAQLAQAKAQAKATEAKGKQVASTGKGATKKPAGKS